MIYILHCTTVLFKLAKRKYTENVQDILDLLEDNVDIMHTFDHYVKKTTLHTLMFNACVTF
jgi:hypothetical protein